MRSRFYTALLQSQKPPSTPHPCSDGYEGGDFFDLQGRVSGRRAIGTPLVRSDPVRPWDIGVLELKRCHGP